MEYDKKVWDGNWSRDKKIINMRRTYEILEFSDGLRALSLNIHYSLKSIEFNVFIDDSHALTNRFEHWISGIINVLTKKLEYCTGLMIDFKISFVETQWFWRFTALTN